MGASEMLLSGCTGSIDHLWHGGPWSYEILDVAMQAYRDVGFKGPFSLDHSPNFPGAEIANQQFFDFLPGPFSGLGMQANFTFVDSSAPGPAISGPPIQVPLELLSKYNYNLVGIYEKGKVSYQSCRLIY